MAQKKNPTPEAAEAAQLWRQIVGYFPSQAAAARWLGVHQSNLSRRLAGDFPPAALELGAARLLTAALLGKTQQEIEEVIRRADDLRGLAAS